MPLEPGQLFGRYTIEHVLGEGGMGRVYRAADAKLLRRVALKILSESALEGGVAPSVDSAALILKEARAAAAITHENAVTIFDVGDVDGVPYIAMEYIQGESLRAFIGDAAVSMEQRIAWLAAIARALAAAHDRGLVHRDVKPENVLVREDGVIKVLDFGIAHHQSLGSLRAIATTSAAALPGAADTQISGTPAYMAPEQLRGEELDGRTDQFAWGLLGYELLTGRHPNEATNLATLIAERLSRAAAPPRTVNPAIPEPVDAIIVRALSKDAEDRFETMSDLLDALVPEARASAPRSSPRTPSALENAPTESATVGAAPTLGRRRGAVIAALALAASAALGTIGVWRSDARPPPVVTTAPASSSTAVTDLPAPQSAKLDAVAEYRAGLQSARDGAGSEARVHFMRASEIDPTMGSAHLWSAALATFQDRAQARSALDHARQQRASLSERDVRLLAVLEPLLDRDPADLAASERIAVEATRAVPRDAHLRLQLAIVRSARGDANALADADAALELDPKYVAAQLVRALTLESVGREDAALEAYERCVADNPASASCFAGELKLLSRKGQCERVAADARRWTTAHPSDAEAFRQRAIHLSFKPESRDNLAELLATSRSLLPSAARPRREQTDRLALALLAGDLASAREAAEKLASIATDIAEHGEAARALVEIQDELGRPEEAARIAFEFLKRRELWAGAARIDQDLTPVFAARARSAKLLSVADADAARNDWLERWTARGRGGERWLIAYAAGAETPDDAKAALAALPRFEPLPALPDLRLAAGLGRVHMLAGATVEAIAVLERATNDCAVLRAPIVHARALLWLADAHAARNDKPKSCDVLRRVESMWGGAPSGNAPATLKRARTAAAAHGCR